MTGPAQDLALIDERELVLQIKDWRRGRATRSIWQAISDGYVAVFGVLVFGAMVVNVALQASNAAASCTVGRCSTARLVVPAAVFAGVVTGTLVMSRLFGPVSASAAEGSWLLDAPVRRSKILWRRFLMIIIGALLIGGGIGAAVAGFTGSPLPVVLAWAAAVGLAAAATTAFAGAEQGANRTAITKAFSSIFGWLAVLALALVVAVAANWIELSLPPNLRFDVALILAAAAALGAALFITIGMFRLGRMRRARLVAGGSLAAGLAGAMYGLDLGLAHDIVVERRALEIGHVKAYRGRGSGASALAWRELQRVLRFPGAIFGVLATIIVPYAALAMQLGAITTFLAALCLFLSLVPILGGLRVLARTKGLARCLPFSESRIRTSMLAVAATLSAIWALATLPAYLIFGYAQSLLDAFFFSVTVAVAGLIGAMRWVVAKPIDFGKPMVATQLGAFPPGLIFNLFRGIDMCLLITAPLLFGWSPIIGLSVALIAYLFLSSGGIDMEAMRAKQEEQQAAMAKLRDARKK